MQIIRDLILIGGIPCLVFVSSTILINLSISDAYLAAKVVWLLVLASVVWAISKIYARL